MKRHAADQFQMMLKQKKIKFSEKKRFKQQDLVSDQMLKMNQ
jgi:hypothetical protein